MNDITVRLLALERSNRLYRFTLSIAVLAIAAIAAFGFIQSQVPDVVRAKKFELVDDQGRVLVSISPLDGSGTVTTFNPDGNMLADIVPAKSGSGGMVFYDGKKKQNLIFTDVSGGGGSIRVNNAEEQSVLSIGRNVNQAGSLTINNKNGEKITLITGDTEEKGAVITYDAQGNQTARVPGSN